MIQFAVKIKKQHFRAHFGAFLLLKSQNKNFIEIIFSLYIVAALWKKSEKFSITSYHITQKTQIWSLSPKNSV